MPQINNISQLRSWLFGCPAIPQNAAISIDYMDGSAAEYAIYSVPSIIRYHENVLGEYVPDDIQTVDYILCSSENYGADIERNADNLGIYQKIVSWIIAQNAARKFPKWADGTIQSLVPTLTANPTQAGANVARYQINIKVTYRRL